MKLHTISFGCQMSVADGEEMARPLLARGWRPASELADADAVIISTCTVRQHAEDRAVSLIGRLRFWKEERPERFIIVAGCAAERIGDWLRKRFPFVDLIVGARSIEQYPQLLDQALTRRFDRTGGNNGLWKPSPGGELSHSPASAYVTVMRGCNYSCSYCIVPSVRGREIHRAPKMILEEVRRQAESGRREVVLLGQTVNSYNHGGRDFSDLLRSVAAVEGMERIRFISPHPYYLTDRLIAAMAECPKVAPHLHLPVQSGSDRVLKAMRRNYTRKQYLERTKTLRARVRGLAISTDLITGFPSETEDEFRETLRLIEEADFCAAYCYKFSPREGTPAAKLPDQIPREIQEERLARMLERVKARTREHLGAMIGKKVRVLLETATDGRTQYHFKARLDEPREAGELVDAVVTGASETALKCSPEIACENPRISVNV